MMSVFSREGEINTKTLGTRAIEGKKMEAAAGVTHLGAKEHQRLPTATESYERSTQQTLLQSLQKEPTLLTP